MPEYTGFALPAAEGWRFAIKAKGPFQLWWGSSGVCATAAADGKFAVKVVENYVGKYGHVTSGEAGKDVEVECGLDGTYLVEVVNQDGRREFRAGGKPIIEFNDPTDFTPRWLLNGGNVVGATLEKLP